MNWLGVKKLTKILKKLDYPKTPINMDTLEEELLKFSNDIRLTDDITIIEARFLGDSVNFSERLKRLT